MRRRNREPDTRPDWRDSNMPVIRKYRMGDGTTRTEVDQDYERRYREMLIETAPPSDFPNWRNDPTYNMKRKPK
jgi:hypothetical protein